MSNPILSSAAPERIPLVLALEIHTHGQTALAEHKFANI